MFDINSEDLFGDISNSDDLFGDLDDYDVLDDDVEEEINYSNYENKVVRIITKGLERLSQGKHKDLYGDICLVDKFDIEKEFLYIEKLGKRESLSLPISLIEKISGVRLEEDVKEEVKKYRKNSREIVNGIKYILRNKVKERDILNEIKFLLNEIRHIGESTFDSSSMSGMGGMNGSMGFNNGVGLNPGSGLESNFGSGESGSRKNDVGMDLFEKDFLGREKKVYGKTKTGKRRKTPTQLMKSGRLYYVELLNKDITLVFVRQNKIRDGVYEKFYYSDSGLVEAREISWFKEKESHERGSDKIKSNFRRVFTLERQLDRLHDRMGDRDVLIKRNEKEKEIRRELLHRYIIRDCKRGVLLYQSKSRIRLGFVREGNVNYIVIQGVEKRFAGFLHKKYRRAIKHMVYREKQEVFMLPMVRGVRRAEVGDLIEDCIKAYGNSEKRLVRKSKNDLLAKYMDKSVRKIDSLEDSSEDDLLI